MRAQRKQCQVGQMHGRAGFDLLLHRVLLQ